MKRLTESELRKLARDPEQYRRSTSHAKQRGLCARPQREGEVAWVARSQRRGSTREKVLGYWPRMGVDEARAACATFRLEERGINVTFGTAAQRYLNEQAKGLASRPHVRVALAQNQEPGPFATSVARPVSVDVGFMERRAGSGFAMRRSNLRAGDIQSNVVRAAAYRRRSLVSAS